MRLTRLKPLSTFWAAVLALACDSGGTTPPGPPAQLVRSGPEHQDWYVNNPLPAPYSVTVRDANNRTVPNVAVDWTITGGGDGSLSNDPSMTNANGIATTTHTLGLATRYVVIAALTDFPAVPTVTFTANASAPPTSAAVSLSGLRFNPASVVVQVNTGAPGVGEVTWTWNDVGIQHNVTFSGAAPTGGNITDRSSGSVPRTFSVVGTYNYTCTRHPGMNGTVTVVN